MIKRNLLKSEVENIPSSQNNNSAQLHTESDEETDSKNSKSNNSDDQKQ
jgi:hypothetical protein